MTADKRAATTDALETLGSIIGDSEKRDAIHLAVEPVIAAQTLHPGMHVGFVEGGVGQSQNPVGIVDPFLTDLVRKGERFWLVVYPRQITSLRHVWTHPAFEEAPASPVADPESPDPVAASRKWIDDFASELDQTYNRLIAAADQWVYDGDYTYDNSETYKKADYDKWPIFWKHYEVVTGRKPATPEDTFFTCSC